nr:hypothetical protein [Blastopirellula retiformator]
MRDSRGPDGPGQHDHADSAIVSFDLLQQIEAGHLRHFEIGNENSAAGFFENFRDAGWIVDRGDLKIELREKVTHLFEDHSRIVHMHDTSLCQSHRTTLSTALFF